ncbi:MAG: hypothetical protein D6785_05035, partial [Planctomycetota bacterium]
MSNQRTLLEIFLAILNKKASGSLVIHKKGNEKVFLYFDKGELKKIAHDYGEDFRFAEYLIKQGKIEPREYQKVLESKGSL